ncbi:MAG: O-antigen translocase [Cytophagaceae bacterium]|nr:O-antigen translocase [Cytophagaceae bacterium]
MSFLRSSLWAALVVIVRSLTSILISREIARNFLPAHFAVFSHFQNLLSIFLTVPTDGINRGLVKYFSDLNSDGIIRKKIIVGSLILNLFVFLFAVICILIFNDYISKLFFQDGKPSWFFLLFLALLLQTLNYYALSFLLAKQQLKTYFWVNVCGSVIGMFLVVYIVNLKIFSLALIATAIGPSLLFFVGFVLIIKEDLLKVKFSPVKDFKVLKDLGGFILMALSVVIFGRVTDFFVREYSLSVFGFHQTGLWQSVVKFSEYYFAAFTSILGMVYYPKISAVVNFPEQLRDHIRSVIKTLIPIILPGLVSVYFLREYILLVFFDEKFLPASSLFSFQVIGDFFKMTSYMLGVVLVAQARIRLFIFVQAVSALMYIVLIYISSLYWGVEGLVIANTIRFFLYFILICILFRKILWK